MAVSACRRVSHDLRQINSALIVLKKVSTEALMLLCSSSGNRRRLWPAEGGEYLSYDVSLGLCSLYLMTDRAVASAERLALRYSRNA